MEFAAGIDFGGTSAKIGLVSRDGTVICRDSVPVDPEAGFDETLEPVARSLEKLAGAGGPAGKMTVVGIGMPGFIEKTRGTVVGGCENIPASAGNRSRNTWNAPSGVPAFSENDATSAAAGELAFGAGRKFANFVLITLGTAIGGGLVLGGRVYRGWRGFAAEDRPPVRGPRRTVVQLRQPGMLRAVRLGNGHCPRRTAEKLRKRGNDDPQVPRPRTVAERAGAGDPVALDTLEEAGRWIAQALGSILNLLDLEACLVGGGVAQRGDILLEPVRRRLPDYCWPEIARDVQVLPAELGNDAGILGAAAQALERLGGAVARRREELMSFTVSQPDPGCHARTGSLALGHGTVSTPCFMPVGTNATVKAMQNRDLEEIGVNLILGNTYHLYLRPGREVIGQAGGLHSFMGWRHNILTDSGGYQVFSLSSFRKVEDDGVFFRSHIDGSSHRLTPEDVMDIQTVLGSDVMMPLDECTAPGIDRDQASEAVRHTTAGSRGRARRWREMRGPMTGQLFGIMQGNFYSDLRAQSAAQIAELDLPGYAIGGLSVGEEFPVFRDFLHLIAPAPARGKAEVSHGHRHAPVHPGGRGGGDRPVRLRLPDAHRAKRPGLHREGPLSLRNEKYRTDFRPIDEECECRTCLHHHGRTSATFSRRARSRRRSLPPATTSPFSSVS